MHFVRLLNTKNVEFYEVYKEYCGESLGYLLFIDTRRPGRLSDNPVIDEIEKEFVGASNFIKVNIITKKELPQQFLEEIQLFVSGLIEEKPDCGFFIHTFVSEKELRYDLPSDMVSIAEFVKPYLKGVMFLTSKNNRKLTVLPVRNLTSIMSSYLFLRKEKDIPHDV